MKKRLIKICLCLSVAFVLCCSFFGQNVKLNKSYALDIQDNVTFTFNEVSSFTAPYYFLSEYYNFDENDEEVTVDVPDNFYTYEELVDSYFPNTENDYLPYNCTVSYRPRLTVEGSELTLDILDYYLATGTFEETYIYSYNGFYQNGYNIGAYEYYYPYVANTALDIVLFDTSFNRIGYARLTYNRSSHSVSILSSQTGYSDITDLNYARFRFDSSTFNGLSSNYYLLFESTMSVYVYTDKYYEQNIYPCTYSYVSFSKLVNDVSINTFGNFDTSFYEYYKRTGVEGSNYYKEDMWKFRGDNSDSNISFSFPSLFNLGTTTTIYDVYDNSNANYNDGYNDGYANGNNVGYNNGYNEGRTTGYNNGYAQGDAVGYSRGVAESNNYSFIGLIGAVIDAPIRAFTGLLNFEILGVNLSGFLLGLFSIALVLFIYRKVKGW